MASHTGFIVGCLLMTSVILAGQSPPPALGTMALEGTTNKVYAALNVVIVKTKDGVEHMIHFTKDLVLHGGKGPGVDTFVGLEEGTTVVVHYTVTNAEETALEIDRVGDKGLQTTEGVVVGIDRRRKRITIKYANGQKEVMQLTPTAAAEGAGKSMRPRDSEARPRWLSITRAKPAGKSRTISGRRHEGTVVSRLRRRYRDRPLMTGASRRNHDRERFRRMSDGRPRRDAGDGA